MGIYLNPGNTDFKESLNSDIYVDKSMLIAYTNKVFRTNQKNICVSRPRRFGKSMAANMLTAYYSCGCDSKELFSGLRIAESDSFGRFLNKYNVIHINVQLFLEGDNPAIEDLIKNIKKSVLFELLGEFPDVPYYDSSKLARSLCDVYMAHSVPFIFIIDEWDCIFRLYPNDKNVQKKYLDFLRGLLKDQSYVALSYMTGILPIKKYGEHSALNMFTEFSMTNQHGLAEFTGFTKEEVRELCDRYNMSFEETSQWYDGYDLRDISVYNPNSVVSAMISHEFDNYWTLTETYEALKSYIQNNDLGVQDVIVKLLAGETYEIDTTTFVNDMVTFAICDDVLTLLVHLGYLSYNSITKEVRIPNYEIRQQFISTIRVMKWNSVVDALNNSDDLLNATISCDEEKVARYIDTAHQENASILKYNDENSLSCVISLAYYSAKKDYSVYREMPAGKGFADMVFVPKKNVSSPAMVIELKWNQSVDTALMQIKNKNYSGCFKDYSGEILLVGINYDKGTKEHTCKIEKIVKE